MFPDHPHHEQISLLESAFSQSNEGMILTDVNSNIITVNSAFCQMTGHTKTKLVGQNPRIMQSGVHSRQFYKDMWRSISQKGLWQGEIWDRKKDGELTPRSLKIKPIKNIKDEIIFYLGLMTDHSKLFTMTRLANQDALTGLPNKRLFEKRLEHNIAHAKRHGTLIALLYIDLDRFKHVNDSCGHRIGDKLLVEVANRLKSAIRAEDTAARLGGDEFIIILSEVKSAADVKQVAQKVIRHINKDFYIDQHTVNIGCSIGYSIFPQHSKNIQSLIHVADNAMYQAKRAGRNTYCCN
ncbi:MAG: sensor domain-containing diguanylate cyclase [Gammaproteobacteria bacterium]|nr:sensor domain-containing diguanylate cyclase [Gammaproteobacteria bacterium]